MDSAGRSVEEVQLEGYFVAALAFIDAELEAGCALAEIEAAATRRRQSLASLPPQLSQGELAQLDEALDFVRRYFARQQPADVDEVDQPENISPASSFADNGGCVADEAVLVNDTKFEVGDLDPAEPLANGNGHDSGNGSGLWAAAEAVEAQPTPDAAPDDAPAAGYRRRSPLSKLWEDADCEDAGECALPEQQALPVARGLLLLAYEAWLAGFSGWVATRLMAWPREGAGYDVTPVFGHLMVLVGVATFAVAGWLIWRYRSVTRRVSALVHAGAVLVALDLVVWRIAANPENIPVIEAPLTAHWELLGAGWLIAGVLAYAADLRAK